MNKEFSVFQALLKLAPLLMGYKPQTGQQQEQHVSRTFTQKDMALINLRQKDGAVIVILGARGLGKTELAYRLAEFIDKPTYAISPEQIPHPTFIQQINMDEIDEKVPPGSTLIADDIPAYMSSRDYFNNLTRMMEKIIPMVRHERKLHLIFCSQSGSQADKYILDADCALIKPGSIFFEDLERPGIKKIYQIANPYFDGKNEEWVRRHAYMITREWQGLIEVEKVN